MLVDAGIALLEGGRFAAGEALDGPARLGLRAVDLVDVGEVARAGQRHAQRVGGSGPLAQLGILEAGAGVLDRLVIVLRLGPGHRCYSSRSVPRTAPRVT